MENSRSDDGKIRIYKKALKNNEPCFHGPLPFSIEQDSI